MINLINESTHKSNKKYNCPFCSERFTRDKLYTHIENKHNESITDEFPVGRIVYNTVNKRTEGSCMVCKKPTKWDEKKERYDSFCSNKCKEEYVKLAKQRMKNKYGREHILDDPNQQNKMLQGRRISGYYTFTSGGKIPYVGSYERKFLEFMDKVLQVKTIDIIPSFPIVEYEYPERSGNKHFWILDFYYVPANLAIDIKDGGDNPNNREMPEYREKQRCKEHAIIKQQEYNYIRLEDNKFDQFLLCLAELKEVEDIDIKYSPSMQGINYRSFIPTNESVSTMGTIKGIGSEPHIIRPENTIYFVKSYKYGMSPRLGISRDKTLKNLVFPDDEFRLKAFGSDYLKDSICRIYEYSDSNVDYNYCRLLQKINENSDEIYTPRELYKHFTGKDFLDFNQIDYDENFHECTSYPEYLKILESTLLATWTDDISIPMLESTDDICIYEYAQDINGYYVYNKNTGLRSRSYNDKKEIPFKVIDFISYNGWHI